MEYNKIYEEFMKEYRIKHEVCPKCGTKPHNSTLAGYIFDPSRPEDYKDLNGCICFNCGDYHTYHERISLAEFNNLKNIK